MKKFLVLLTTLAMILTMAACGSKTNEQKPETAEEPAVEEARDVLAGTTYELTGSEFDNGNGWEANQLDTEHPAKIVFNSDGTFTETAWAPDFENNDFDTLVEVTYTGTYSVNGNDVTFNVDKKDDQAAATEEGDNAGESTEPTAEEEEALKQTITIDGDKLIFQSDYSKLSDGSEILGSKNTYTKAQ